MTARLAIVARHVRNAWKRKSIRRVERSLRHKLFVERRPVIVEEDAIEQARRWSR